MSPNGDEGQAPGCVVIVCVLFVCIYFAIATAAKAQDPFGKLFGFIFTFFFVMWILVKFIPDFMEGWRRG